MNKKKSIALNSVLLIYVIIYQIILSFKKIKNAESFNASIILIVMFLSIMLFGYRKDIFTKLKKHILIKIVVLVVLFFLITYSLGIIMGFCKNVYSLSPTLIINNMFMPIVIIICTEVYRYVVCSTSSRMEINITTFALIIFEILISIKISFLFSIVSAFKYTSTVILPIIGKNIFMAYLTKHGGLKSTLVYRLVLDTYVYLVPIIPDFSDYIRSMIYLCTPLFGYIMVSKSVDDLNLVTTRRYVKKKVSILRIVLTTILIVIIMLVSDLFTYTILSVGSNSMYPNIEKGDAVIIKKTSKPIEIKVGDVIAYINNENKKIIIHRLIEITDMDGELIYITKGDANENPDKIKITYKDIKGIVKFKIKYIGKPSVYISEKIK